MQDISNKYLLLTAATNFDNYDGWYSGSGSLCMVCVTFKKGIDAMEKNLKSKMYWLVWQLYEIWCLTMTMRPNDLLNQNFWLRISMDTYITTLRRCSELLIKLKASSWESRGPHQEVTAKLLTWPFQSKVSDQESCKIIYLPLLVMSM